MPTDHPTPSSGQHLAHLPPYRISSVHPAIASSMWIHILNRSAMIWQRDASSSSSIPEFHFQPNSTTAVDNEVQFASAKSLRASIIILASSNALAALLTTFGIALDCYLRARKNSPGFNLRFVPCLELCYGRLRCAQIFNSSTCDTDRDLSLYTLWWDHDTEHHIRHHSVQGAARTPDFGLRSDLRDNATELVEIYSLKFMFAMGTDPVQLFSSHHLYKLLLAWRPLSEDAFNAPSHHVADSTFPPVWGQLYSVSSLHTLLRD